jgi:hypothetical protein
MDSRDRKTKLIGLVLVTWLIVTPFVWRDLKRRSADEVRGPKWLWRLASTNLTGSLAYFVIGRKRGIERQIRDAASNDSNSF